MKSRQWLRLRPLLWLWLPVSLWMGLIFLLSAQPDLPRTGTSWLDQFLSAGAHVLLFGVLAMLLARALGGGHRALPMAFTLTLIYALSDEFHQGYVPGRHPDALDLLWDALGAALGLGLYARLLRCPRSAQRNANDE
jgi:VanZ family protein